MERPFKFQRASAAPRYLGFRARRPLGVTPLTAATAQEAREVAGRQRLDVAIINLLASDGDGLWLAFELLRRWPHLQVVLMAGTELAPDETALCDRQDFAVLRKPFLAQDVLSIIQARLLHSSAVGG